MTQKKKAGTCQSTTKMAIFEPFDAVSTKIPGKFLLLTAMTNGFKTKLLVAETCQRTTKIAN